MKDVVKSYFILFPWRNLKSLFAKHETKLSIIHNKCFLEQSEA